MVNINIRDTADEFCVEIAGRFAGSVVNDVLYLWKTVLVESDSRRFTIDIGPAFRVRLSWLYVAPRHASAWGTYLSHSSSLVSLPEPSFGPRNLDRHSSAKLRKLSSGHAA